MRGRLITFEGGEGTGKSTHAALLADRLKGLGIGVVLTREPGGSPGAEAIRHVLLSGVAKPLGAEADATWIIDATGQEVAFAYVNAVLRDWARLGLMLANRGNWQGKTVVPEDWLTASAANALPTEPPLAKYGYQIWYSADTKRFSLRGLRGQCVLVDPDLKLVLVQTALSSSDPEFSELFALWTALRTQFQ